MKNSKILMILQLNIFFFCNITAMKEEKPSKKRKRVESTGITKAKRTKTSSKFLDMTNRLSLSPQFYYGGRPAIRKKNENEYSTGELVDLSVKDPIKNDDTFEQLIQERHAEGLPYVLAVLTVQVNGMYARRYQDAGGLVAWMYNHDFTLKDLNRKKYVQTQEPIIREDYFILYPNNKTFEYLGNSEKLFGMSTHIESKTLELEKNLLISADMALGDDIFMLGWFYDQQKKYNLAEKMYLMAIEKGNNALAMSNLGNLYLGQKKYNLAEKYYLMAAAKNNVTAMINLLYLFAINKTSTIDESTAKNFYQRILQENEYIKIYMRLYPDRWKVIQETME